MKKTNLLFQFALITASLAMFFASPALAQRGGSVRTDSRILYHNGPVMQGTTSIYLIWYGNWSGSTATDILDELTYSLGSTPYFFVNTTYPDANGNAPNGALIYGGSVSDAHSHGPTLTVNDIQDVVADQIESSALPLDTAGIYIVVGSADVTDMRPDGSTFCTPGTSPHHGVTILSGSYIKYGYLGSPDRCPTSAAPQFVAPNGSLLPTPNGNFAADAMASTYARLLNVIVTNPLGYGGWYDRYGLENSDKCVGKFGTTYTTLNGARANMQLGQRHFLIQQNWINDRRGRCTLSIAD